MSYHFATISPRLFLAVAGVPLLLAATHATAQTVPQWSGDARVTSDYLDAVTTLNHDLTNSVTPTTGSPVAVNSVVTSSPLPAAGNEYGSAGRYATTGNTSTHNITPATTNSARSGAGSSISQVRLDGNALRQLGGVGQSLTFYAVFQTHAVQTTTRHYAGGQAPETYTSTVFNLGVQPFGGASNSLLYAQGQLLQPAAFVNGVSTPTGYAPQFTSGGYDGILQVDQNNNSREYATLSGGSLLPGLIYADDVLPGINTGLTTAESGFVGLPVTVNIPAIGIDTLRIDINLGSEAAGYANRIAGSVYDDGTSAVDSLAGVSFLGFTTDAGTPFDGVLPVLVNNNVPEPTALTVLPAAALLFRRRR